MDDWEKAGKIAAECLEYGLSLVSPGVNLMHLAVHIEKKIIQLGGKPAFPVNLSLNKVAAHYAPLMNDETEFKKGDMLKIDVGVHVNGCIGDTAATIGGNKKLIEASRKALEKTIPLCKPGTELREIGKVINETIESYGFKSIKNLSGHLISEYNLHAGFSIPNHNNNDSRKLQEGMIIAIEPFATDGNNGLISESVPSNIYLLENPRPVRDPTARKFLKYIKEEFGTLPFAARWLENKFGPLGFGLKILVKEGIVRSYPQLVESSQGIVSQAEHTIRVGKIPLVLTKR
ncbi:MAG: type II methionyl aminopeptidase [Nanoarchaeota archaeon]|nr:type II methionyl aminopeptidase [Nanoarchaeota archaeon]MBU4242361.1 type II methionyl aminopeptidase [Nanoarchaeota archaeon]MBU4352733.1 type II methionyl aminopeptidase [Nanoarchaeota archaeon]